MAEYVFTGAPGSYWNLSYDWFSPDFGTGVPGASDNVYIDDSVLVTYAIIQGDAQQAASVAIANNNQLYVQGNGSLSITDSSTSSNTIFVGADLDDALIVQTGGVVNTEYSIVVGRGAGDGGSDGGDGYGQLIIGGGQREDGTAAELPGTINAPQIDLASLGSELVFNLTEVQKYIFSTPITGYGGLVQDGQQSWVVLTTANTYTGGTFINAGTVQIGDDGTTGSLGSGEVHDGDELLFDLKTTQPGTATVVDNLISGSGGVIFDGDDIYDLTHVNTFSGGVSIDIEDYVTVDTSGDTTVEVTVAGALGGGAINNNGVLEFNAATGIAFYNPIGGTGAVRVVANDVALVAAANYSGTTTIGGGANTATLTGAIKDAFSSASAVVMLALGTLDLDGDDETIASLSSSGANGSSFVNNSDAQTAATLTVKGAGEFDGIVENTGAALSLTFDALNSQTLFTLGGDNTYTGATTVEAGTLQVGNDGTTGSLGTGAVTIDSGTQLTFDRTDTIFLTQTFFGLGDITFDAGAGAVIEADNASLAGTVTIDSGQIVQLGADTATGALGTATVVNNGSLYVAHSGLFTLGNAISGAGELDFFVGTTSLTGRLTYSGNTVVVSGVLEAAAANILSQNSVVDVATGAELNLTGYNQTIAGLTDAGDVEDQSGATLTIDGGGTSTLTGTLTNIPTFNVTMDGMGTQILDVSYPKNATIALNATITEGTLQVDNVYNNENATFVDNAALVFDTTMANEPTAFYSNAMETVSIGGTGSVEFSGGSYLTQSVYINYSGATTIDLGASLQIGVGGESATFGSGEVDNNGQFILDRSGSTTISNMISGIGNLYIDAGSVTFNQKNNYSGATTIEAGSTLTLAQTSSSGSGAITFDGSAAAGGAATLNIDSVGSNTNFTNSAPPNLIGNFSSADKIDLADFLVNSMSVSDVKGNELLHLTGHNYNGQVITSVYFDFAGVSQAGELSTVSDSANGTYIETSVAPCYVRGTRIATARGEIAVEDLRIGDLAVTAGAGSRPIVWLGHRSLDLTRHGYPALVLPIRVSAHAFGKGLPHRDLWLSPEHAVFVEGRLIPIGRLVNGATITQRRVDHVEYWHVELESHDVLLAEGLPAESYLDCGNRRQFVNGGVVALHPEWRALADARNFASPSVVARWRKALAAKAIELGHGAEIETYEAEQRARARVTRSNFVRNPRAEGCILGPLGAGGEAPRRWRLDAPEGVAIDISGAGEETGLPFVEIRFRGRAAASGDCRIYPEPGAAIVARRGQSWTISCHLQLVDGALDGVAGVNLYIDEMNADGVYLTGAPYAQDPPCNDDLAQQRVSATRRLESGDAAAVTAYLQLPVAAGTALDLTLRVAGMQIEAGRYASDPILPPPGAPGIATRHELDAAPMLSVTACAA